MTEAKSLLAEGVKELNLISQDSTYYGLTCAEHSRAIASPERFTAAVRRFQGCDELMRFASRAQRPAW